VSPPRPQLVHRAQRVGAPIFSKISDLYPTCRHPETRAAGGGIWYPAHLFCMVVVRSAPFPAGRSDPLPV